MPDRRTVEAFVAHVESGDFVGALETYYAPDASMQENGAPPRRGLEALIKKEQQDLATMRSITGQNVGPILIEDTTVAIQWRFNFVFPNGTERTLEEVAWQVWHGDHIVRERFFYDPGQLRA